MQEHEQQTAEAVKPRRGRPLSETSLTGLLRAMDVGESKVLTDNELVKRDGTRYGYSTLAATLFYLGKRLVRKYSMRKDKASGGIYVTRLQ